jgi:hypothetical protein
MFRHCLLINHKASGESNEGTQAIFKNKKSYQHMQTSSLFSLDLRDLGKGLLVAVGGAVIATIETSINAGSLSLNWPSIGSVALAAGLAYLGKNFLTPAQTVTPAP